MFNFLFAKKATLPSSASHPSQHRPTRDANWSGNATDAEYDDVSLETNGRGEGVASRHSFSAPTPSRGSFVGVPGSAVESSYPPLPSFSRPSTTNDFPSLRQTFSRLEATLAEQSPTLLDSLSPPLSPNDPALTSLLHSISPYHLPPAVLHSYALHDGQDPFAAIGVGSSGAAPGLVWGLHWMAIDEVEQEWRFWRQYEDAGGDQGFGDAFSTSVKGGGKQRGTTKGRSHPYVEERGSRSATGSKSSDAGDGTEEEDDDDDVGGGTTMRGMSSFPEGWVRRRYSHPGWLPLLTDRCGNYIGVDLDPPPPLPSSSKGSSSSRSGRAYGQPGQVIAFGREIDEKVVLFPGDGAGGWGRFLAAFVDDLERGEFAKLGDGESRRGGVQGWRGDEESGSGRSTPDSDEWSGGDGIGDRGYFDGDSYGEAAEENGGDAQAWVLRSEFRRNLSQSGGGGLIGVIAERSRRKWRSMGVGARVPPSSTTVHQPSARVPLSVVVSNEATSSAIAEAEPASATTVRAPSPPNLMSTDSANPSTEDLTEATQQDTDKTPTPDQGHMTPQSTLSPSSGNVEVVLSPPSPEVARTIPREPRPSSSTSSFDRPPSNPRSPELLDDGRSAFPPRPLGSPRRKVRRPPPPPPAMLDLPTMFDLDVAEPEGVYGDAFSPTDDSHAGNNGERLSSSSIRSFIGGGGTTSRGALLPTHSSSSGSLPMMMHSNSSGGGENGTGSASASTVELIPAQESEELQLAGLGIDSPELDKHHMESVVVDGRDERTPSPRADLPYQA